MAIHLKSVVALLKRPSHTRVFLKSMLPPGTQKSDISHLDAAMQWLRTAQDITGNCGVSAGYELVGGWLPAYPETTGYIIPTFLQYGSLSRDESYIDGAIRMGDWEIDIQLPSGLVRGGVGINDYPVVFNTGQVVIGWLALYRATNKAKYLEAANKAVDALVDIQAEDGQWNRHSHNNCPHAYHTRVAWPIMTLYAITRDTKYKHAVQCHVRWVMSLRQDTGWFEQMEFVAGEEPLTHTIAYTLRGLLEIALLSAPALKDELLHAVFQAAENIMYAYERRKCNPYGMPKFLPATFARNWKTSSDYSCLTGNAQIAIIWLKLFEIYKDARLLNAALKILDQLKTMQDMSSRNSGIRGAIPGSNPLRGGYVSVGYPNWATKFFADATMLQEKIMLELEN